MLEEEQEMLNSSLIALTTHFAQVQGSKLYYNPQLNLLCFILHLINTNILTNGNSCTGSVSSTTNCGRTSQRKGNTAQRVGGIRI